MQYSRRLLKLVLYCYPKQFRQHYGQEILQVFDDLIDDAPTKKERLIVIARTYGELPLSILQVNSNNIGENFMNRIDVLKNRKITLVIFGIILTVTLITSLTVLKKRVVPLVAQPLYKNSINKATSQESELLGNPLMTLGSGNRTKRYDCAVYATDGIKTEIGCENVESLYVLRDSIGTKEEVLARISELESRLKDAGYSGGYNGVTINSLISGTYTNIDYSPDAFYQKVDGKHHCTFQANIAYTNPSPAAFSFTLSCTRTVNMFGVPSTSVYQSSEGLSL